MKTNANNSRKATPATDKAATPAAMSAFETVKRNFETAHAAGGDYTAALLDLSQAIAYSTLNKCLDPQRKTAADRDSVSDNGQNPALLEVKRGIYFDRQILDNTANAASKATKATFTADGDPVTVTADKDAENALNALIGETLSDGIDLVNTTALALLEQAAEHATAPGWLDRPYTVRRLSKRVYIRTSDSAAYADVETTPIQEVYREVRTAIQNSRAIQTDPRNGYTYIEDVTIDGLDTIYYRLQKYANLGGYNCDGNYTADRQTVEDYESIIERLELSDRQAQVLRLRMQGRGYKAIGTYLGVDVANVKRTMKQVQAKAVKIGLTA
nr:hypothetical protein [Acutalibacter muris]